MQSFKFKVVFHDKKLISHVWEGETHCIYNVISTFLKWGRAKNSCQRNLSMNYPDGRAQFHLNPWLTAKKEAPVYLCQEDSWQLRS